ncbi:transcription elongation factor Elf1 like-domain-containing protein [Naematelia encephala]|uniref:Transcription elongation factor 1 homolog n=1 Tax=Naematelia encephala TaxID=71784 RepID=A0A1Y2AQW9_9TREE|nr:transcription elongation factor Elf1 like-domain-containing protein [Naematelia encephala]
MGKRKSSSKPAPKKAAVQLPTTFKCIFCNVMKVTVSMDKSTMTGTLRCKHCEREFRSPINNLSAPVDVFCDWVDAAEELRQKQPPKQRPARPPSPLGHGAQGGASMDIRGREVDEDADADADGEVEEEEYDRTEGKDAEGEEVDEDEDDGREKRRRAVDDEDEDDDEDD